MGGRTMKRFKKQLSHALRSPASGVCPVVSGHHDVHPACFSAPSAGTHKENDLKIRCSQSTFSFMNESISELSEGIEDVHLMAENGECECGCVFVFTFRCHQLTCLDVLIVVFSSTSVCAIIFTDSR
ncbi:unnamed protein product [Soboliphyme baturini]|uniref:Uncharacterized protein n=1 Tax=Soboliphyme baturini TaxID=241478 RepID=A0A183J0U1_9BILA|nr:unnamed protein product [Soboliphyme baturini]